MDSGYGNFMDHLDGDMTLGLIRLHVLPQELEIDYHHTHSQETSICYIANGNI